MSNAHSEIAPDLEDPATVAAAGSEVATNGEGFTAATAAALHFSSKIFANMRSFAESHKVTGANVPAISAIDKSKRKTAFV